MKIFHRARFSTASIHKHLPWMICAIVITSTACSMLSFAASPTPTVAANSSTVSPTASTAPNQIPTLSLTPVSALATPTTTVTPSPTGVLPPAVTLPSLTLRAQADTNCRTGPAPDYDVVGYLLAGDVAQVAGRNSQGSWWFIQHPKNPAQYCWVWAKSTQFEGVVTEVQVVAAPPTPTSQDAVNFSISYNGLYDCGANMWAVFNVSNTGGIRFNSAQAEVVDTDNGKTLRGLSVLSPPFRTKPCGDYLTFLDVRSSALIAVRLSKAPPAHHALASIRLCSGENMAGRCMQRSVKFTLR